MPDIKRKIKIVTQQKINASKSPIEEGFPVRDWSIEVYLLDDKKNEIPATIFERVTYQLHASFGKKAKQVFKTPPFKLSEEGWGEFELEITFSPLAKGANEVTVKHDLNFLESRYEVIQDLAFKNPKGEFLRALEEHGGETGGRKADKKRAGGKRDKNVDMEKLADQMQQLGEEDLLHVVQMIHDQKTGDSYVKNDADNGEFHVDLYTLPDQLVKSLWEFVVSKKPE